MRMPVRYVIVAICLVLALYGQVVLIRSHEAAHVKMFQYCGISSEVHYNFFGLLGAYTEPENFNESDCPIGLLNGINEEFGYQFQTEYVMFSTFFIMIVVIVLELFVRIDEMNKGVNKYD